MRLGCIDTWPFWCPKDIQSAKIFIFVHISKRFSNFLFLQPSSVYDKIGVFAVCRFKTLLWLILLCISWSCLYCDSVYCKKWCYDVLGEWWTFYRNPAANSFHLLNSRCLRPEALVFLPSQRRLSMCDILDEFAFDSIFKSLACDGSIDPHMSLWKLNSHICCFPRGKTMWVHCQGGCMVRHFSGMHPSENLCGSRLVCIFIWSPQPEPYFKMTAEGFLTLLSWTRISKEMALKNII